MEKFKFEDEHLDVEFIETSKVVEGVECDVYKFKGDKTKDLGIIRIKNGYKTPLQKVLKGDKTIEGFISGSGRLVVKRANGITDSYNVDEKQEKPFQMVVEKGDIMQWIASVDSNLEVYEVCFPPYEDGRFENL